MGQHHPHSDSNAVANPEPKRYGVAVAIGVAERVPLACWFTRRIARSDLRLSRGVTFADGIACSGHDAFAVTNAERIADCEEGLAKRNRFPKAKGGEEVVGLSRCSAARPA